MSTVEEFFELFEPAPFHCEGCGALLNDFKGYAAPVVQDLCESGCCVLCLCPVCRREYGSFGPVDCPTCSGLRPAQVSHMRRLYRRRRRRW